MGAGADLDHFHREDARHDLGSFVCSDFLLGDKSAASIDTWFSLKGKCRIYSNIEYKDENKSKNKNSGVEETITIEWADVGLVL